MENFRRMPSALSLSFCRLLQSPRSRRDRVPWNKLEEQRAAVSAPPLYLKGGWEGLCLTLAVWTMALLFCGTVALAGTIQLPQTGQAKCYEGVSPYAEIPCAGTGQDGDKKVGVAWTPDIRFATGTGEEVDCVTDNLTGLMWVKNPSGTMAWQDAIDYAQGRDLCGFDDWRLPSVIELESMLNAGQSNSAAWLNTQGFSDLQGSTYYWSSTTVPSNKALAWGFYMSWGEAGGVFKDNADLYVWPVRGGQAAAPADIWETGQKTCYDGDGNVIMACEGTEQDGDLKPGVAWPNPRFADNGNGTVTDNLTGLIWLKNANCFISKQTWANALSLSNSLADGICGLNDESAAGDWRLPNRKELLSLADSEYSGPALSSTSGTAQWSPGDPFANVQSTYYWSSTTYANGRASAWHVTMLNGAVQSSLKTNSDYVWPVRGGQSGLLVDLTISKTGSGAVTVDKGALNWADNTGTAAYIDGMVVTLTAQADTGSTFAGWGGDADCSDGSVTVNSAVSCTATFILNQHTLTVDIDPAGTGSGTVGGGGTYDYGTTHDITAAAAADSTFSGWSGDCSGTASPLSVLVDRAKTCTATFAINNVLRESFGGSKTAYTWIQDAFDYAEDGDTILIRNLSFSEDLYFDRVGISVLIQGGCDTEFTPITGYYSTVLSVEVRGGTFEVDNLILE